MNLTSSRRHFADRRVNTLYELVERAGQQAKFIFAFDYQTTSQVTFALSDVLHGSAHGGQRAHQELDQQAEQNGNDSHGDEHCDECGGTELGKRSVRFFLV
mgnify:CR=1 FL=1